VLWTALPFGIIGVLTFTTPDLSSTPRLVTPGHVPTAAPCLHHEQRALFLADGRDDRRPERAHQHASYRQICANAAGFIVQSLAIPMVIFLGHGSNARGYQLTMGIFSAASVFAFVVALAVTKERIQARPEQDSSVRQDMSDLLHNGPWTALFLVTTFYFTAICDPRQRDAALLQVCAGNQISFQLVQRFGVDRAADWRGRLDGPDQAHGKRHALLLEHDPDGHSQRPRCSCSRPAPPPPIHCPGSPAPNLLMAAPAGAVGMMGDVADYGEWKTGHRATATVTSGWLCAVVGSSPGRRHLRLAALGVWLRAGTPCKPERAAGIRLSPRSFPARRFLPRQSACFFYGISMKLNLTISHDLAERRKSF